MRLYRTVSPLRIDQRFENLRKMDRMVDEFATQRICGSRKLMAINVMD